VNICSEIEEVLDGDQCLRMEADALHIDGIDARQLAEKFGTPLFVVAQQALSDNYRRLRLALDRTWPSKSSIFFSVKSNPNIRVAQYFAQLGAGMDVFSSNELRASVLATGRRTSIVLNGNAKEKSALRELVEVGGTVNIDSVEEIETLQEIGNERRTPIDVNVRVKPDSGEFSGIASDYFGVGAGDPIMTFLDDEKWGFSAEATIELVQRLSASPTFRLRGFSSHMGRVSADPTVFEVYGRSLAKTVQTISQATGFVPQIIDAGGGWPRRRDPESRTYQLNKHGIEEYLAAFAKGFIGERGERPVPELWIEPGRYLVGNAVVLLSKVVSRKVDLNRIWLTVDTSTNHLARVDTSRSRYFIVPGENAGAGPMEEVEIVGPTCVHSVLASRYTMPRLAVGSLVAVLDAGMYAESAENNFNLLPRPACVLASEGKAELIRRKETFEDVLRAQLDVWKE
jgi:diaminopimelate decarboxylase